MGNKKRGETEFTALTGSPSLPQESAVPKEYSQQFRVHPENTRDTNNSRGYFSNLKGERKTTLAYLI